MKYVVVAIVAFVAAFFHCSAEIIEYNEHFLVPLRPEYLTIPKFAPSDAPNWLPGHGRSYIDLTNVQIRLTCDPDDYPPGELRITGQMNPCTNSTFELLMFEEPSAQEWMEYWPDRQFCCTSEMVAQGDCLPEELNHLIVPADLPGAFLRRFSIKADEKKYLSEHMSVAHHDISKSGVYILFMAVCNPSSRPLQIHGQIESMDPYGYLPADLFGNLPFYGALSLLYSLVGIAWMAVCTYYSNHLIKLQMWITVVLGLGMIETTLLFAHYLSWNDHGHPAIAVSVLGIAFGVSKRAASRVLIQLVALGYGVVRPSLGEDLNRVLYLGGSYFLLSLIYTLAVSFPGGSKVAPDPEYDVLSLVVFLLAGVDTTFYIWILTSINNLLTTLAARQQAVKYILYRNFRAVLFVSLFSTCIWALYGSVVTMNDGNGEDSNWKDHWTVDALWELTYFVLLVSISVMWRPSQDMQRVAYGVELSQLDEDEEYKKAASLDEHDVLASEEVDAEYGGRLNDEGDPFLGKGALDPAAAISKKA